MKLDAKIGCVELLIDTTEEVKEHLNTVTKANDVKDF